MSSWNGLDFIIFLILTLNTIIGLNRGATKEIVSTMCLSAALIITIQFTVPLSNFFAKSPIINDFVSNGITRAFMQAIGAGPLTIDLVNEIMYSIALLICFVGAFSICGAGLSVTGFTESFSFPFSVVNRKLGGTLGFTRGYIITLVFLSILSLHIYKTGKIGGNMLSGSFFARLFSSQTQMLDQLISSRTPEYYQKLYQNQPYNEENLYQHIGNPNNILDNQSQPSAQPAQQPTQ